MLSAGTRYKKSYTFNVTYKLQKLLHKGQEGCNAIHRVLPRMCPISLFITVKKHKSCLNVDIKCSTADHIYCTAANIFVKLAHIIQRNNKRRKNKQDKSIPLIPDYFSTSAKKRKSKQNASPLQDKKLSWCQASNKYSYFKIKCISPQ